MKLTIFSFFVKKDKLFILSPLVLAGISSGIKILAAAIKQKQKHDYY